MTATPAINGRATHIAKLGLRTGHWQERGVERMDISEMLEAANQALKHLQQSDSNESRLLRVMSELPEKYDWGDFDTRLGITVFLPEGSLEISRMRGHSTSESLSFSLISEDGDALCSLKFADGRWVEKQP